MAASRSSVLAATGREAVTLAKRAEADVVLMDMSMPILDGPAATRRLVALEHAPKVIALSGHSDKLSRAAALDSGAAAYVTKAEGFDDLVRTILETCGRVRRVGEISAESPGRAARPDAASSVAPIASAIEAPCVLASERASHPGNERHSAKPS